MINNSAELSLALFQYATEGIIVTNDRGQIIMANPRSEEMFGYTPGELLGKSVDSLVPREAAGKHVEHRESYSINPHARSMGAWMDLYAKRKDDTTFPVEVSLSPFKVDEKRLVLCFVVDISERKKQENKLKKLTEEYIQLNTELEKRVGARTEELADAITRLAESKKEIMSALEKEKDLNEMKSRFVTTASHEFRTPLSTILSSVSLISKYVKTEENDKRQKHIDRIKSAVTNLTEILNEFLSLGKLEEGMVHTMPSEFNLAEFARTVVEEMQSLVKPGQKIMYEHTGTEDKVSADRQILKNSLVNLLSNAVKYSDEGKKIEFSTQIKKKEIIIHIQDHGIGIPEEDQHHLFERFFRAKNSTNIQGTGLGLNIVKKYVELMGGTITFTSKLEEGTRFTINLPQHTEE